MALVVTGNPNPERIKSFLKTIYEIKELREELNNQKEHNKEGE